MATLTINTTAEQAQRVVAAFGKQLGLMEGNVYRNATAAEVKQALIQHMRQVVQQYEVEVKRQAVTVDDFDPT